MNYEKNYNDYIGYVKTLHRKKGCSVYYEEHHILPKSLGGLDSVENLVLLTPREHFLAHYLLTKFTEGQNRYRMLIAFGYMRGRSNQRSSKAYCNSRLYESIRNAWWQHYSMHPAGPNPAKASCKGKHWYKNVVTGEFILLLPEEVDTTLHVKGRGTTSDKQKSAVSISNKKNARCKGKHWSLTEDTKRKHCGKKWYINKSTGETKQFSESDSIDLSLYKKGRRL